jgi:perosamine synthetase
MRNDKIIPLSVPNLSFEILDDVKETIESGWVSTGGRFIQEFETKIQQYVGAEMAVSCQSGTAALHLALRVLGIGPGDEVIVPTLTFIASVNPVKYMGAEPVFMDCDDSLNIDTQKLEEFLETECIQVEGEVFNRKTNKVIKAIIVVHVFGNPVIMESLMGIRKKYNISIIEDAAEALGSYYTEGEYAGRHCGTIGDIGVYSFNANKIITTGGGGMVVSNQPEIIEQIAYLSTQAKTDPVYFIHDEIGYNYRMTNVQAAFGINQIARIENFIETKIQNYNRFKTAIESIEGLILLPWERGTRANHWFYSLLVDVEKYGLGRDELLKKLNENNVQTRPLWGLIHKQKPYLHNQIHRIERAEFYERNLLNLPCSTNLNNEQIEIVIGYLEEFKANPSLKQSTRLVEI